MSIWTEVFLGVIAAATLAIAVVQVGVLVAAGRLARRLDQLATLVEQELRPVFGHLNAIGRDGSRAASLATAQVERVDRLISGLAQKIEQTVDTIRISMVAPGREGRAILSAFRVAIAVIRELRQSGRARQGRGEDEDALFI